MKRLLITLLAIAGLLNIAKAQTSTGAQWRSFGPFTGYVSSVPRQAAPLGALTDSSLNWLYDPVEKKISRRFGQFRVDSTFTFWLGFGRARQVGSVIMPQHRFPTIGTLYTTEAFLNNTGIADGRGVFAMSESTGAGLSRFNMGSDAASYANDNTSTGRAGEDYLVTPVVNMGTTAETYTRGRGTAPLDQLRFISGSRKFVEVGNWVYFPNAYGTPLMWNKTKASGGSVERIRPWGHYPPMFSPTFPTASYPTSSGTVASPGTGPWKEGDQFWVSVIFKFEDGSYSPPLIPTLTNQGTGTDSGFVKVKDDAGTASNAATYAYVPWRHIPCGPAGTVARILCRTPKSQNFVPGFRDLRITAIINDNVTCNYNDPNGDDNALVVNNDIVHFDMMWPPAAQYTFANDSRTVVCGSVIPNPAAIIICPTGRTTRRDLNDDGNTATGLGYDEQANLTPVTSVSVSLGVKVTADSLVLISAAAGFQVQHNNFTYANFPTVRDLVNAINSTQAGTNTQVGEWAAQVAPGADETARSTSLAQTTGSFGDSLRFQTGGAGVNNIIGVRGPTWPAVLFFNRTWQLQYPRDEQTLYFTGASPGHAQSATNNFYVGNRRAPPSRAVGRCMGGGAVKDKFIVCYERGIYVLKNMKGGGTGEDEDLRLFPINDHRGCISWSSIAAGYGVVGYLTEDGYVITDGETEVLISQDVWSREKQRGEWLNEVTKSARTVSTDDSTGTFFHAQFFGRQLHVTYRKATGSTFGDRRMVYDFSASPVSFGIGALLNQGQPFGWSTPLTNSGGPMALATTDASGPYRYTAVENTATGRLDRFDVTRADSSVTLTTNVTAFGFTSTDLSQSYNLRSAEQFLALYQKPATGLTVTFYRDQFRATSSATSLASSANSIYTRSVVDLPTAARTPTDVFEFQLSDDGTGPPPSVWALALKYRVLDSVR